MASFLSKTKLLHGLMTGDIAYAGPFHATIDLTRRCNLKCPCCRWHSPYANLPSPGDQTITDIAFPVLKSLLGELKTMGTRSVTLTGEGEPFLHPRFFDIVSAAKAEEFMVTVTTNGTLLNSDAIRALIDSQLDILKVSFWESSRGDRHEHLPAANLEHFERAVNGMKLLRRLKAENKSPFPSPWVHYPINRHNFDYIEAIPALIRATGSECLSIAPLIPWPHELAQFSLSKDQESNLGVALVHLKKRLKSLSVPHNIDPALLSYEIGESVWERLPCYVGWLHAYIKVDGTVLPCCTCELPLGNLQEGSLKEIWNAASFREFRRTTITRKGLATMSESCYCGFCCHIQDNVRVHRLYKWIAPFFRQRKSPDNKDSL